MTDRLTSRARAIEDEQFADANWLLAAGFCVWVCLPKGIKRQRHHITSVFCVEMKHKLRRDERINNIFLSSSGMLFMGRNVVPFHENVVLFMGLFNVARSAHS